jgi:hypothetical protein
VGSADGFAPIREALETALRAGWREQISLVRAVEEAYAFLDAAQDDLGDAEVMTLRILLAQAETQMGRYFGM